MNPRVSAFVAKVDSTTWLRMLICFLPGLVASKLSATLNAPLAVSLASSVLLLAGVAAFMGWYKIRTFIPGLVQDQAENEVIEAGVSNVQIADTQDVMHLLEQMEQLRKLCSGEGEMLALLKKEASISPEMSFPAVIEITYRRRKFETTSRSGN